jgi:hypothetical protein
MRVSLTAREGEELPSLAYGNLIEIEARVRQPANFGNPGAFDFAGYLARRDIYWTASARGVGKLQRIPGQCGSRWQQAWFSARFWALDRVESLFHGDPYTIAMMSGMLLGDSAAIERSWTGGFRRTGTYHNTCDLRAARHCAGGNIANAVPIIRRAGQHSTAAVYGSGMGIRIAYGNAGSGGTRRRGIYTISHCKILLPAR